MKKINIEKQDSVKLYKIRKTLEELSQKSGRGTELITVYIPKESTTCVLVRSDLMLSAVPCSC